MCYYSFDISMHLNKIKWVKNDSGRQLLTGSFHPVNDKNWYQNAKLEPGTHVFYRVVLEGFDYPDGTSKANMAASSTTVRKAIVEIFAEKDTKPATLTWYLKNDRRYVHGGDHVENKPKWWGPRIVLVSAATQRQVDDLKLSLVCATPKPFESLSYERFEIVVGTEQIGQISLAQAMAQPALNRCAHCSLELLVPNRCVSVFVRCCELLCGICCFIWHHSPLFFPFCIILQQRACQKVSYCNKTCQMAHWKCHRKKCKRNKKKKK
jgi:hypothetical protein